MVPEPTVYVVDDDDMVRAVLIKIFEGAKIRVKTYASAEEFLATYSPKNPGCLLLDVMMPQMGGLELQKVLAERGNATPIVFLTGSSEVHIAVEALKVGAIDYIEKLPESEVVLNSVRRAMELDAQNRQQHRRHLQIQQRVERLTARESEVMSLVIRGKTNKAIAQNLDISLRTVEVHRKNLMQKMEVESAIDLLRMLTPLQEDMTGAALSRTSTATQIREAGLE